MVKSLLLTGALVTLLLWVTVSSTIMRAIHPDMTETELFINLPRAFFLLEPYKKENDPHPDSLQDGEFEQHTEEIFIQLWGER